MQVQEEGVDGVMELLMAEAFSNATLTTFANSVNSVAAKKSWKCC